MESSANNRYELLFMDDDAGGGAPILPDKKKTDQSVKKSEKENKSNPVSNNKNKNNAQTKTANANSAHKRNGASNTIKEMRPRNNRVNVTQNNSSFAPEYNTELPQRQYKDRDNKFPARFRANEKFGKREFDRQSGSDKTGIKPIDKRDGAGAHNWGSAKQDIEDHKAEGATVPGTDKEESANNEQSGEATNNLVEDEEAKQMTLDEWKALKDQRAKPNYNLRKAGEGVDNSEWKKMIVLSKKKGIGTEDDDEELEFDASMYPQRVGRLQRIVDIQFNFNDGRKSGFRKGMRGPPARGDHYHRQETAPNNNNGFEKMTSYNKFGEKHRSGLKTLKVDDEIQFPTLA
ncbi:plasminogen activator inhibitor 1 RNA-binding protein [Drosophila grimshawi]|uniref:GH18047 n=1 Tax=Drosophila grimshawi TaxID=7222 RepID=B4JHP5_DROGR|nr:plasminogen activator inhibitor 1 RNA-binding protein [Drosophila grimshawi]EDV93884.1 GH18047 [Drosophila grimshawi]